MESITVTTTLSREDWAALLQACGQRIQDRNRTGSAVSRMLSQLPWIGLVGVLGILYSTGSLVDLRTIVGATALFVVYVVLMNMVQRRKFAPDENGAFIGQTTFEFRSDGFSSNRSHCRTQMNWAMLRDITRTPSHVFLWIDAVSAYCIRVKDLPSGISAEEFEARLLAFRSSATGHPVSPARADELATAASSAAPTDTGSSAIEPPAKLIHELYELLRLNFFLKPNPLLLVGRDLTIAWLIVFNLLLWTGAQWLDVQRGTEGRVEFMWWSVPDLARYVVWILAIAWTLARLASPPLTIRRALLLVLGFLPWLIVAWLFIGDLPRGLIFVAAALLTGWAGRYLDVGARAMTGTTQYRAVSVAFGVALGIMWFGSQYTFTSGLWHAPDEYENEIAETAGREQLEFDQPARIDAKIAAMAAPPAGKPAVYFVGFAGYGDQRVFADEIAHAAAFVGERYQVKDRRLLLINDRRDYETNPYATAPALRHALAKIGQRMDVEQDVLFLSLSSHGDADATLSVSNEFDVRESLSGTALRAMLDESGIRWRVIVISACHSGSFIEHLANERTIVLTAAAKERTSFGCSDDRDMTYFGEAFYRDALPGAADLRSAFEAARESIAKREAGEARTGSDPQSSFGALLEAKLAELEKSGTRVDTGE